MVRPFPKRHPNRIRERERDYSLSPIRWFNLVSGLPFSRVWETGDGICLAQKVGVWNYAAFGRQYNFSLGLEPGFW